MTICQNKTANKLIIMSVIGAVLTSVLGSLFHFVYEWTGESFIAALFSAVNESTWEHMKLLFMPYFFLSFIEYFIYGKCYSNFFMAKLIGVLSGLLSIIVLFYSYVGVVGDNFVIIDILIFIISVFTAYGVAAFVMLKGDGETNQKSEIFSLFMLVLICALFFIFTFNPPEIGLFLDPLSGGYGIQ